MRLSLKEENEVLDAIAKGFVPFSDDDNFDSGTLSDAREFLENLELKRINEQRQRRVNKIKKSHGSRSE